MFYENVNELCKEHKTTITKMSEEIGLSNAAASSWKKGSIPKSTTVQKIADYFGVTTDYLLRDHSPISASNVRDSVVLQGNTGNNTVSNGDMGSAPSKLTEQEEEVLRIFRSLGMRKKTAVLSYLYELEDGGTADRCD